MKNDHLEAESREAQARFTELARGLVHLSTRSGDVTALFEIGVHARRILEIAGRSPEREKAVLELLAACEAIVLESATEATHARVYPPAPEEAGRALRRFRALVLPP